jgi:RNA polymerase sigma-70 factor (ECF subfamily)
MTLAVTTMDAPPETGSPSGAGQGVPIFTPEDRQLLQDCLHGQSAAWDAFVTRFIGLFAFVVDRTAAQRQMPLTPADREDLLADILLEMLHQNAAVLRGFAGRSSLATYLAVVARRVAVRGLSRLAGKNRGRQPLHDGHGPLPVDGDSSQDQLADREQVERMLVGLEEMEARLVRLHHLEARSYGEISRLTGMPLGSIGPTLARARHKMKLHGE